MKRLFVAIPIPEDVAKTVDTLKDYITDPTIRWVRRENLHITVFFMGYVHKEDKDAISSAVKEAITSIRPFSLEFAAITPAPLEKPPSMIWAMYKSNDEFQKAVITVEQSVRKFTQKTRNFKRPIPHVTLARFRERQEIVVPQLVLPTLNITSLVLYESYLTPEGPMYVPLEDFPLIENQG